MEDSKTHNILVDLSRHKKNQSINNRNAQLHYGDRSVIIMRSIGMNTT